MKKVFVLSVLFCVLNFYSCDTEEYVPWLDSTSASLVAREYLALNENQYTLNLTEQEALQLRITQQDYLRMLVEIETANQQIQEWLKDSNAEFILTDPNNLDSLMYYDDSDIDSNIRLKSRSSESFGTPSGHIATDGQEVGRDVFFAPSGIRNVTFLCRSNVAITPIYNVTTQSFGITKTGGGIGAIGVNSSYTVGIAASNVDVCLTFKTSDSNGGECSWSANY